MSPMGVVLIPFIASALIALAHRRPRLRELLSWLGAIAFFLAVLSQIGPVLAGEGRHELIWTMMPGLEIAFAVGPLGLIFALVASGLWLVATLYANSYMKALNYDHLGRFFACYAIALGSAAGIAFSANLLTLFIFYEVLSISTYPLVAHSGSEKARRGGRTYLFYLLGTSIGLLLPAIIWTWYATGTTDFVSGGILAGHIDERWLPLLAGLFFFGIGKAALMPVHRWLPAAMVAPAPVSALLHAVAVVKAGVFTLIKVVVYIFGTEFLAMRMSIKTVKNLEEALQLENSSPYGNASSIYTTNGEVARKVINRVSAGMCGVNIGVPVPREPFGFGGWNDSKFGQGDITGWDGFRFWTQPRKVTTKWALQKDANWMS